MDSMHVEKAIEESKMPALKPHSTDAELRDFVESLRRNVNDVTKDPSEVKVKPTENPLVIEYCRRNGIDPNNIYTDPSVTQDGITKYLIDSANEVIREAFKSSDSPNPPHLALKDDGSLETITSRSADSSISSAEDRDAKMPARKTQVDFNPSDIGGSNDDSSPSSKKRSYSDLNDGDSEESASKRSKT